MTTLAEANIASEYETWASYWSQCRITLCVYEFPIEDTSMDNPLIVRWREIPEGENVDEPHPEIEVQQLVAPMGTECIRALLDVMPDDHPYKTVEGIEKASMSWHEDQLQRVKDFEEYLEYRANGNIKVETIDETQPITWESIRNASTEELFQTKLEIFESPPVQESENKDWRQNVRKSESIIEAMYWYYKIVNNEVDESEEGEEKIPENIDIILDEVPSEIIFKHKLQIFEKEEVQNSENKKARAKIRKSTNLIDMLSAYSEIVNEGSKA